MTKMITALDGSPQSEKDFIEFMKNTSPFCRSFGVIDKNNELGLKHEAPIIGFVMFEPMPPCSLYAHIASSRRAWGTGLMEEAAKLAIDEVFKTEPGALRVSAAIPAFNKRAIEFAKKVGMHKDGFFLKAATIKGKPINIVHFGIIREDKKETEEDGVSTGRDSEALDR